MSENKIQYGTCTDVITKAFREYLNDPIDWDFIGKPLLRQEIYPKLAADFSNELTFTAGYQAAKYELLNTPELNDFGAGVTLEALHQRQRWGSEHDAGKTPADWFWLIGYLAGKALNAHNIGDSEKAKHHLITTAAALANWHASISGENTEMRPGIIEPKIF